MEQETRTPLSAPVILDAEEGHMPFVQAIYRDYVLNDLCTFEEQPPTTADLMARRQGVLGLGLPYLVALVEGQVAGYAYASAYRGRPAYRHTVEDSIYVARDRHGRGIGKALLAALIARCAQGEFRQMIAVIGDSANAGSIHLHTGQGFAQVGVLRQVGWKFDRWVDVVLMQRVLR
jgi:L-amino acid N-acyltransferase YncA